MSDKTFGSELRAARERAGKTQKEASEHIGISAPYVSGVERGERKPLSNEQIVAACELFGIHPGNLLVLAVEERHGGELLELAPPTPEHREVAEMLVRKFPHMGERHLNMLWEILDDFALEGAEETVCYSCNCPIPHGTPVVYAEDMPFHPACARVEDFITAKTEEFYRRKKEVGEEFARVDVLEELSWEDIKPFLRNAPDEVCRAWFRACVQREERR